MFREVEVRPEVVDYHRNGVSGAGFHVITFQSRSLWTDGHEEPWEPMFAVVFEEEKHVAVFNREKLGAGDIGFAGGNSWRGDVYELPLRREIAAWRIEQDHELNQTVFSGESRSGKCIVETSCGIENPHNGHYTWAELNKAVGTYCPGLCAVA